MKHEEFLISLSCWAVSSYDVVLETDIGKKKRETQDEGEVQVSVQRDINTDNTVFCDSTVTEEPHRKGKEPPCN